MLALLDYAPLAATAVAIPQFVPQIVRLRRTGDTNGLSWSWAALTCADNAAWFVYFATAGYATALVPATSATLLSGTLAAMLALRGRSAARPAALVAGWAAALALAFDLAGHAGLGVVLTAAFLVQVTPSIWTAYRTPRPTGLSAATWTLIFAELSCWLAYGLYQGDPRLVALGATGVVASILMLVRIQRTRRVSAGRDAGRGHVSRPAVRDGTAVSTDAGNRDRGR